LQLLFCVGDPEAKRQRMNNIPCVVVKTTQLTLRFPQRGVFFYETVMLTSFFGRLISTMTHIPSVEAVAQIPL
jgi:hypothetical protein